MCGLYGVAKPQGLQTDGRTVKRLLSQLAWLNEMRGSDSTGLALVRANGIKDFKTTEKASDVVQRNRWKEFMHSVIEASSEKDHMAVIGHTRAKTVGAIKNRNAHPFMVQLEKDQWVLGAHNGTVSRWTEIRDKLGLDFKDVEVDSEVIFHGLSIFEDREYIPKILPFASMALTYFKNDPTKLHLFRDSAGTLWFQSLQADNLIVWSSSLTHLMIATAGMEGTVDPVTPNENTLISFDLTEPSVLEMEFDDKDQAILTSADSIELKPDLEDPFITKRVYGSGRGHTWRDKKKDRKQFKEGERRWDSKKGRYVGGKKDKNTKPKKVNKQYQKQLHTGPTELRKTDESEWVEFDELGRVTNDTRFKTMGASGWHKMRAEHPKTGEIINCYCACARMQEGYGKMVYARWSTGAAWDSLDSAIDFDSRGKKDEKSGETADWLPSGDSKFIPPSTIVECVVCGPRGEDWVWNMLHYCGSPFCRDCFRTYVTEGLDIEDLGANNE